MKKVEAFVRPERLDDVKASLLKMGHRSMINYDIWYRGTENEINQHQGHGRSSLHDFMPKVKIELMVKDESVQNIIEAICDSASSGQIGDGKIFILPAEEAVRIQTRETGDAVF
jgi:nitrogen regulatory protein P-II 1